MYTKIVFRTLLLILSLISVGSEAVTKLEYDIRYVPHKRNPYFVVDLTANTNPAKLSFLQSPLLGSKHLDIQYLSDDIRLSVLKDKRLVHYQDIKQLHLRYRIFAKNITADTAKIYEQGFVLGETEFLITAEKLLILVLDADYKKPGKEFDISVVWHDIPHNIKVVTKFGELHNGEKLRFQCAYKDVMQSENLGFVFAGGNFSKTKMHILDKQVNFFITQGGQLPYQLDLQKYLTDYISYQRTVDKGYEFVPDNIVVHYSDLPRDLEIFSDDSTSFIMVPRTNYLQSERVFYNEIINRLAAINNFKYLIAAARKGGHIFEIEDASISLSGLSEYHAISSNINLGYYAIDDYIKYISSRNKLAVQAYLISNMQGEENFSSPEWFLFTEDGNSLDAATDLTYLYYLAADYYLKKAATQDKERIFMRYFFEIKNNIKDFLTAFSAMLHMQELLAEKNPEFKAYCNDLNNLSLPDDIFPGYRQVFAVLPDLYATFGFDLEQAKDKKMILGINIHSDAYKQGLRAGQSLSSFNLAEDNKSLTLIVKVDSNSKQNMEQKIILSVDEVKVRQYPVFVKI